MEHQNDKNIAVVYHADCRDGFSGAWVCWKKFYDDAMYVPMKYDEPAPNIEGKEVYFIDIIPKESILKQIISNNRSVTGIDHHASNEHLLSLLPNFKFEINKSASVLTWEHFFPDKKLPVLLKYVQDMDLIEWQSPASLDIFTYINFLNFDFDTWDQLSEDLEDGGSIVDIIRKGALLNAYKDKKISEIIERNAQLVRFEGLEIFAANSSTLRSPISKRLIQMRAPAAIVWVEWKDKIHVSLRSDGSVDVSVLAKKYGGGGHPRAAGFRLPLGAKRPWSVV